MKLRQLVVGGFGALKAGLSLKMGPGFNLVLARNEMGKTTLAQLITSLFYGFGKRRGGSHPLEPWAGGEVGGQLTYSLDDGRSFQLSRHLVKRGDKLDLTDDGGTPIKLNKTQPGEHHLGLSRGVFLTVSRVQLDDLQRAFSGVGKDNRQASDELKGYFFQEAATRGELANPVTVLQTWQDQAQTLYSSDRRRGRADQALVQEIAAARESLAQAQADEDQARRVQAELESLHAQAAALENTAQAAKAQVDTARKAKQRADLLARRREIQNAMAALAAQGLADDATLLRARDLEKAAGQKTRSARKAAQEAAAATAQATGLVPQGSPQELAKSLSILSEQLGVLQSRKRALQAKAGELDSQSEAFTAHWGSEPAHLAALDPELPFKIGQAAEALGQAGKDQEQYLTDLAALGPQPPEMGWGLNLGLAGAAAGVCLALYWQQTAPGLWALQLGGTLFLAGAALAIWGHLGRRKAWGWRAAREALLDPALLIEAARNGLSQARSQTGLGDLEYDPPQLSQAISQAGAMVKSLAALDADQANWTSEMTGLEKQAVQMGAEPGSELGSALGQARERCQKAAAAQAEADRLSTRAKAEQDGADAAARELKGLLEDAGYGDMKGMQEAALRSAQIKEMTAQLKELDQQLGGEPPSDEATDPVKADQTLTGAQAGLARIQTNIQEMGAEQGRQEQELRHLAAKPAAAQAQAVLDGLEQRRGELAQAGAARLLASAVLEEAMEQFRLESQPSLMNGAAKYLSRISQGSYAWLGSDLFRPSKTGEPALKAQARPGAPEREASDLSRGTQDQLYLCLRLALGDEITSGGESAPLILDDPLVNMDDQRLAATLQMLAELAQTRQVLLLTCHRQQAQMLQQTGRVTILDLE